MATATSALLTPLADQTEAVDLSGQLFRKQVLPLGSVTQGGETLSFDRGYLDQLARMFRNKPFDQVPFTLVDSDNRHNMDPNKYGGEVKGMELTDNGLDALIQLTPETAELVRKNPKLGASVRILRGYQDEHGQQWPHVIRHVAGTLDPRVTGMKPWQRVDLSGTTDDVADYSDAQWSTPQEEQEQEEVTVPQQQDQAQENTEEQDALAQEALAEVADQEQEQDQDQDYSNQPPAGHDQATQDELDLVHAQSAQQASRIQALETQLAQERFETTAQQYVADGVPPHIVELARPILSTPQSPVIDLAGQDQQVDVSTVVSNMLDEIRGMVQLSQEQGSTYASESDREEELLRNWQFGG